MFHLNLCSFSLFYQSRVNFFLNLNAKYLNSKAVMKCGLCLVCCKTDNHPSCENLDLLLLVGRNMMEQQILDRFA